MGTRKSSLIGAIIKSTSEAVLKSTTVYVLSGNRTQKNTIFHLKIVLNVT